MASNNQKQQPITDVLELGEHKYTARLVEDKDDGSLVIEHSVFTGRGDEKRFLGNVQTLIYAHNAKGHALMREALKDPGLADEVTHKRNRQAISDGKNDFRSAETRPTQPLNQLKKKIEEGLPADVLARVKAALGEVGVDISKLVKK